MGYRESVDGLINKININILKKPITIIIILAFLLSLFFFYQALFIDFTEDTTFQIYTAQFIPEKDFDYNLYINYTSKGAFIAGQDIHVDAKLELLNQTYRNSNFVITFPASQNLQKTETGPINQAQIDMSFDDDGIATGSVDLIYFMPGEYEYNIIIDGKPVHLMPTIKLIKFPPEKIIIAPLETKLQVENNNRITRLTYSNIGLSLIIFTFTLIQILLSIRKNNI